MRQTCSMKSAAKSKVQKGRRHHTVSTKERSQQKDHGTCRLFESTPFPYRCASMQNLLSTHSQVPQMKPARFQHTSAKSLTKFRWLSPELSSSPLRIDLHSNTKNCVSGAQRPICKIQNAPSQSFSIISQEISWERANWINFLEYLVLAEATIGLKCLSLRFSWMRRKGLSATQSLANAD